MMIKLLHSERFFWWKKTKENYYSGATLYIDMYCFYQKMYIHPAIATQLVLFAYLDSVIYF